MIKLLLLLIITIVSTLSLTVVLFYIVTAINEKDFTSLIFLCSILSVILIMLIDSIIGISKL